MTKNKAIHLEVTRRLARRPSFVLREGVGEPKFPHIHVQLTGTDGNAFAVMGVVGAAMRKGGCSKEDVASYHEEAMKGDYQDLLRHTMATVNVH